jgi:DNA-binding transcriptional ArsR family regulator
MALRTSGHPPPSLEDVDRVFLALAHDARRQMLILLGHSGGELPSGYLAARFAHSWPTTSRHLKVLEEAGLVEVRRQRRSSKYRLNRERLNSIVTGWLGYLEPTDPAQRWTPSGPRSTSALARRALDTAPDLGPGGEQPDREKPDKAQHTRQTKRQPRREGSP